MNNDNKIDHPVAAETPIVPVQQSNTFSKLQTAGLVISCVAFLVGFVGLFTFVAFKFNLILISAILIAIQAALMAQDKSQFRTTGTFPRHKRRDIILLIIDIIVLCSPFLFLLIGGLYILLTCSSGGCTSYSY